FLFPAPPRPAPYTPSLHDALPIFIVTDHHTPGEQLPDCLVVHPKLSPLARDGLPELTGSGVAFHLLWALHERLGLEAPLEYADLDRKSTRLNSSHVKISYAVFCLK